MARRAPRGPPKAERGADGGRGAAGAALILYGLIQQWSGAESESQVGQARDQACGIGVGELFTDGWGGGVADHRRAEAVGVVCAGGRCGDQGALLWRGADRPDDLFEEVRG